MMSYFAIQVMTTKEDAFKDALLSMWPDIQIFNIKKQMRIRKRGKLVTQSSCLFPGYLFVSCKGDTLPPEFIRDLRKTNGFVRVLPSTDRISPLNERDTALITRLLSFGREIGPSLVTFTPDKKIKVIKGALEGLEGMIVSVNKRKRRVKIKTQLSDAPFVFDLSIDILEVVEEPKV